MRARGTLPLLAGTLVLGCTARHDVGTRPEGLRIYLARHGQTAWNAEGRLQGQRDVPLDETGRAQARRLGERLAGIPLVRVYSSNLVRSRETAAEFAGRVPIESLRGLDEQALGRFEGLHVDGREGAALEEYRRRRQDPDDDLDGGESRNAHLARVRATIEEILTRHSSGAILIVGHGGTNQLVLAQLLDLSLDRAAAIQQANDEVFAIDLVTGRAPLVWKLVPVEKLAAP
jgi:broad specificity phosphatase PhoE